MITRIDTRVTPQVAATPELLRQELSSQLKTDIGNINDFRILRKSIDARQRQIFLNLQVEIATDEDKSIPTPYLPTKYEKLPLTSRSVTIIGAGPAGLFAALRAIEHKIKPILIERGQDVDNRRKDLAGISRSGIVKPDSNYCFGEGGAGAYSDGKLFTRSKKRGNPAHILQVLHQHGAHENILIDSHPHIGSDRLPLIVKNIRNTILQCGGEIHFGCKLIGLRIQNDILQGIETSNGDFIPGPAILATGHSARDVYNLLYENNVEMEAKDLAIGVRLEHPQKLIDCIRYHSKNGRGKWLQAAEYSYVTQIEGRGVYSFCMCPGGIVVPAASAPGELVVNGMSPGNRGSRWANSAMVVEIHRGDFSQFSNDGVMEMIHLQEWLEKTMFQAAGNSLKAPAQRMMDFVNRKISTDLPQTSYAPGLQSLPMHFLLPKQIADKLREGFKSFDRKNRGFLSNEATVIGLESRTSSPLRILRNTETLQHIRVKGLYPVGEGAGYAGGIVSAAMDGEKAIDALALTCFS